MFETVHMVYVTVWDRFFFFFQAEDGIRDVRTWLEFRRVLFRSCLRHSSRKFPPRMLFLMLYMKSSTVSIRKTLCDTSRLSIMFSSYCRIEVLKPGQTSSLHEIWQTSITTLQHQRPRWNWYYTIWKGGGEIGRAHVWTPVTSAHLVCRLLLEKKKKKI